MSPIEITLYLLLFATLMFVWERIPLALTAIIVCLALVLTGVLDAKVAFNGFINTNVILFVGMFIVGGALLGVLVLGEPMSWTKVIGLIAAVIGVVLISL